MISIIFWVKLRFLKITEGIGKKLNASEARALISLHKIAKKMPGINVLSFAFSFSYIFYDDDFKLRSIQVLWLWLG